MLPAETIAEARPSRTASAARTRVESFFVRTDRAGSSSIAMTSVAAMISRSPVSPRDAVGRTDEHDGDAELRRAAERARRRSRREPCRPRWRRLRPEASVDLDRLAALVPAAVRADDVGQLRVLALRASRLGRESSSTHAEARRLLLFAFEVFFFGTAIGFLLALVNARLRAAFDLVVTVPASAAHRGSVGASHEHCSRLRFTPHSGQSPAQSARHNGANGRSRIHASRTTGARSSRSPCSG